MVPKNNMPPMAEFFAGFHKNRSFIENEIRKRCWYHYLGNQKALTRILGKYDVFIDTSDVGIAPHLILDGFWEIWITAFIARTVKKGMTAFDIGANVGYYTLLMADLAGPDGKVITFEANPDLNDLLQNSCRINSFGGIVENKNVAVSSNSGDRVNFIIPVKDPKNGQIISNEALENYKNNDRYALIKVPTFSLNDLNTIDVDFMKIDVEGAEIEVWNGMETILENNRDIQILLEFNASRYQNSWEKFYNDILYKGFKIAHVDFDGTPKKLSKKMIEENRAGEDWMMYLSK